MAFPPTMNRAAPPPPGMPMRGPPSSMPMSAPPAAGDMGNGDMGNDAGDNGDNGEDQQLSDQDVQALQNGVSPDALKVLQRVLPDDCQYLVDAISGGGGNEEGAGDQTAGREEQNEPPRALPNPTTRLGRL